MNINELTLGQLKEIGSLLKSNEAHNNNTLNYYLNKKVIIRTYSAGVWFGELVEKSGNEVILKNARRMWRWWARKSISLSGVAVYGIIEDKSNIAPAVENVWLEAIEILSLTEECIKSIEGCKDVEAE